MEGLRRRSARRLSGLRLPYPFDLDLLCDEVAASRGRPLHRRPLAGLKAGAPCGLWLGMPTADYVFYDPGTSPLHAEHIVLHEIAHILCGHAAGPAHGDLVARLFPDLDPALVARMLGRAGHTTAQEREAEMLASMIRTAGSPARDRAWPRTRRRVRTVLAAYRMLIVLRPLWSAMRSAFPEVVLWRPARSAVELRGVAGVRLRLYRRVIEIRDGMLALRDHLPAGTAPEGAAAEARAIAAALSRLAAGEPPADPPGRWAPVGPDMADEIAWLSRVSVAYRALNEGAPTPTPAGSAR
ncbi:DUF6545 domain-containing protein [Actinoplanes sp. NPDC051861]|uniref:DUF6545 domain-containing protein n=1 Tax=Actinoplanes sp. NPDC051861 TaxID=3155170 RepID=UPI00341C6786